MRISLILFLLTCCVWLRAQNTFFESIYVDQSMMHLDITSAWDTLIIEKNTLIEHPAQIRLKDKNGRESILKANLTVRGKSRRKICEFPPIRIKLDSADLVNHQFQPKDKKIKLTTHCSELNGDNNLLKEYLVYKLFNLITEKSFRVQLMKIRYRKNDGTIQGEHFGILSEDAEVLASRIGGREIEAYGNYMDSLNNEAFNDLLLFEYMISNTDWKINVLHNIRLIQTAEGIIPVPYDFDYSGLVNTAYAKPNPDIKQEHPRDRVPMGKFTSDEAFYKCLDKFKRKQQELMEAIDKMPLLPDSEKRDMQLFLEEFYREVNKHPKKLKQKFF